MTLRRSKWWPPVAAVALAILVGALAILQYRWTGEISRAESERLRRGLDAASGRLADDFDREVNRAFHFFRVSPEGEPIAQLASRMDAWQQVSPSPAIVGELLLVMVSPLPEPARDDAFRTRPPMGDWHDPPPGDRRGNANRAPGMRGPELRGPDARQPEPPAVRLFRFDRQRGAMVPAAWRPDLETWRLQYEPGRQRPQGAGPEPRLELIDPHVPALAIPFSFGAPELTEDRRPRPGGVVIVRLDRNYVVDEWIPAIVSRHFPVTDGDRYDVSIRGHEGEPIDGRPSAGDRSGPPDAVIGVLSLRPFPELAGIMPERGAGPALFGDAPRGDGRGRREDRPHGQRGTNVQPGPGLWTIELRHAGTSMEEVVARSRARNLAVSGVVLFLLAISSGLLVVAARRAERLAAQQMELVAGVTHELNTPIAALCSAGQNLADGVVSDEAQVRKYGEMITREGRRLSSMVAQMLQFAGIQSGERAVQTRRSRLEPIIDAAIADLAWLLGESGVHVETDVAAGLPDVEADPDALTRAISNLVSNAVKYRGTSTTVRVVASRDSRVGWVRIDVEDRGIGIASSDLANVFEPFYRGRSPEIATIRGSGLGLSIVRQVVREHGGTVDVVSAPGKGSTFSIRIPAYGTQGGGR